MFRLGPIHGRSTLVQLPSADTILTIALPGREGSRLRCHVDLRSMPAGLSSAAAPNGRRADFWCKQVSRLSGNELDLDPHNFASQQEPRDAHA